MILGGLAFAAALGQFWSSALTISAGAFILTGKPFSQINNLQLKGMKKTKIRRLLEIVSSAIGTAIFFYYVFFNK